MTRAYHESDRQAHGAGLAAGSSAGSAPHTPAPDTPGALSHIRHWIFDLDDTLYSRKTGLFAQIKERVGLYIEQKLGLSQGEAQRKRMHYYKTRGTALAGLIADHQIDVEEYLNFVHDLDYSVIVPDEALAEALRRLPGDRLIFTNGDFDHAVRVAGRLGIIDAIDAIHDISAARFVPKPNAEACDIFLRRFALDARRAAMFEDTLHNLDVPASLGMATVHVVDSGDLESTAPPARHAGFVTDDLTGFLHRHAFRQGPANGGATGPVRDAPGDAPALCRLAHIAIAVPDLDAAAEKFRDILNIDFAAPCGLERHGVRAAFARAPALPLELMEPLEAAGDAMPLAGFLKRHQRGGLHHICLEVPRLDEICARLKAAGLRILGTGAPVPGADGRDVVFVDPRDFCGVLLELRAAALLHGT